MQAFVSRSFNKEDEDITSRFIKQFNAIHDVQPNFTWIDAESAEAERIINKIAPKINNSDIFIAICTKKEQVLKKKHISEEDMYEWKTSDWIIQEIGFAIAKEKRLIIFVEEEMRIPIDMMIEWERIPFNRENIEDAIKKFNQMLGNILIDKGRDFIQSNKSIETLSKTEAIAISSEHVEEIIISKSESKKDFDNINSWTEDDYHASIMEVLKVKDIEKEKIILNQFITKFRDDNKKIIRFKINIYQYKKDIYNLNKLLEKNPNNTDILIAIAEIYESIEDYDLSFQYYYKAFENQTVAEDKFISLYMAVIAYIKSGKNNYFQFIEQIFEIESSLERKKRVVLGILNYIYNELIKNDFLSIVASEGIISDYFYDNSTQEYSLAYKYSQLEMHDLSYLHYSSLIDNAFNGALNNLALEAEKLDLKWKSKIAFSKAVELGDEWGIKNLAIEYLNRGFLDEAENICLQRIQQGNPKNNLYEILSKINIKKKKENEDEKNILIQARNKKKILAHLSKALVNPMIKGLPKKYKHSLCDCLLETEINVNKIRFTGTYESESLLSKLINKPHELPQISNNYKVEIEGEITGHLIEATYLNTLVDSNEIKKDDVLLIIEENNSSILYVYDKEKLKKIFELTAVEEGA